MATVRRNEVVLPLLSDYESDICEEIRGGRSRVPTYVVRDLFKILFYKNYEFNAVEGMRWWVRSLASDPLFNLLRIHTQGSIRYTEEALEVIADSIDQSDSFRQNFADDQQKQQAVADVLNKALQAAVDSIKGDDEDKVVGKQSQEPTLLQKVPWKEVTELSLLSIRRVAFRTLHQLGKMGMGGDIVTQDDLLNADHVMDVLSVDMLAAKLPINLTALTTHKTLKMDLYIDISGSMKDGGLQMGVGESVRHTQAAILLGQLLWRENLIRNTYLFNGDVYSHYTVGSRGSKDPNQSLAIKRPDDLYGLEGDGGTNFSMVIQHITGPALIITDGEDDVADDVFDELGRTDTIWILVGWHSLDLTSHGLRRYAKNGQVLVHNAEKGTLEEAFVTTPKLSY